MKKILFTALCDNKAKHDGLALLLERNLPRLEQYCQKWNFELRVIKTDAPAGSGRHPGNPIWSKFGHYILSLKNELADGDVVVWIDSDTVLVRADYDLTPVKNFAISLEPRGTFNAGVMAWKKCSFSEHLIQAVWDMTDKDIMPGLPLGWIDQPGILTFLYSMSDDSFQRNVQVYPQYVNVTGRCDILSPDIFRNLVIRHFAGNAEIEWDWFKRPLRGL